MIGSRMELVGSAMGGEEELTELRAEMDVRQMV